MTLGAVVGTFLASVGTSANAFLPFVHQSAIPAWFVVVFLLFAMVQLFAINSLDLYSSGVTLQALGVKVKRYQAVIIDSMICLGVTIYAVFDSSFSTYLKDFVDVVIIWIAPWVAIYLVDWGMRKWRYVPSELQRVDRGSLYWSRGGVHWPAIIAQVVGMAASMSALYPTFSVPSWMNPITVHTRRGRFQRLHRHRRRWDRLRRFGLEERGAARPLSRTQLWPDQRPARRDGGGARRRRPLLLGGHAGRDDVAFAAAVPVLDELARRLTAEDGDSARGRGPERRPRPGRGARWTLRSTWPR
jgi:hypothetical protein